MKAATKRATVSVVTAACIAAMGAAGSAYAATNISFMAWTTCNEDVQMYKKVIDAFQAKHKGIKVKFVNVAWAGDVAYLEKLMVMTAANVAPDTLVIPMQNLPRIAESGVLYPVDSFMKGDKSVKESDYFKVAITASTWKSKLWGLPMNVSSWFVTYNKRIFDEAGFVEPEKLYERGQWNFENLIMAAQKTARFDGNKLVRIGIAQMNDLLSVMPYAYGYGGKFLNPDGTKCLLGEKSVEDGLNVFTDLVFNKKVAPLSFDLSSIASKGQFAMSPWWNTVVSFYTSAKIKWPMNQVPFPVGPKGKETVSTECHTATVSGASKHKKEAWEFIKFLTGQEGTSIQVKDVQWPPAYKGTLNQYKQSMIGLGVTGIKYYEDGMDRAQFDLDRSVRFGTMYPKVNSALAKVWTGKASLAAGLAEAVKNANQELGMIKKK